MPDRETDRFLQSLYKHAKQDGEDPEDVAKRIYQNARGIGRRELMQAGALGAGGVLGGASVMAATERVSADASTSDSDGNVGTPNDPVDGFFDGVRGKEINNEYYLREYADNPEAAGTASNPWLNALNNLLSQESAPYSIVTGPGYYKEQSQPVVSNPGLQIRGAWTERADNSLPTVIATPSGVSGPKFDGDTGSASRIHLDGVWFFQEAMDQTGTGLELLDGGNLTGTFGAMGYSEGVVFDGWVYSRIFAPRVRDCGTNVVTQSTNRSSTNLAAWGGRIGGSKSGPGVRHGDGGIAFYQTTFERNQTHAFYSPGGAYRAALRDCFFENNDEANGGNAEIYNDGVLNVLVVDRPRFVPGPDPSIELDGYADTVLTFPRRSTSGVTVSTTANHGAGLIMLGNANGESIDSSTNFIKAEGGNIQLSPDGAKIYYDSGEIKADDDAGNTTTLT